MNGKPELYDLLNKLAITFDYYEHPPAPTIEIAFQYWKNIDAAHCKNLFFRNHKGDKHYLCIFHYHYVLNIKDLEQRLRQGKLTFASEQRMQQYLGLKPGSVSPFGLMHDSDKHVHVFIDEKLREFEKISFHPNENTASLVINFTDFEKFMNFCGNSYDFIKMYEN